MTGCTGATPGPHAVTEEFGWGDSAGESQITVRAIADGRPLAVLAGYDRDERLANAALFAASTALQAALHRIHHMAETGEPGICRVASDALAQTRMACSPDVAAQVRLADAAPRLLDALRFAVRFHDRLTPSDIARMQSIIDAATGAPL